MTCEACRANKSLGLSVWRCPKHLAMRAAEKKRGKERRKAVGLPVEPEGTRKARRRAEAKRKAGRRETGRTFLAAFPTPPPRPIRGKRGKAAIHKYCPECQERASVGMMWCERHR
jgi:hypothetical protein